MDVPVLVLLGFAGWTLLTLCAGVGVHRWHSILTRRTSIVDWWTHPTRGSDWYQRAMRAHINCVENLPVYMAIVLAQTAIGLHGVVIDSLSLAMLAARIGQTTVHIALRPTDASASLRFALFFVQLVCMITIGVATVAAMVS